MTAWYETPEGRRMPLSERIAMFASFGLLILGGWMVLCPDQFTALVTGVFS